MQASFPPTNEPSASPFVDVPAPPSGEAPVISPPPLEVHREQVIEDNPVVRIKESDGSGDDVEQINNANGILDYQEESNPVHFLTLDLSTQPLDFVLFLMLDLSVQQLAIER